MWFSVLGGGRPLVVACVPAIDEEGSVCEFVVEVMSGDALNKRPRSFMVEWGLPWVGSLSRGSILVRS
jgi:hypothetical protein